MLTPEFFDRYRQRLATPSERYIAIYELLMKGLLALSILLGICTGWIFQRRLCGSDEILKSQDGLSPGFNILIVLGLAVVLTVLYNALLNFIYKKWMYPILSKKYRRWPDTP